jgi:hypothetical protein
MICFTFTRAGFSKLLKKRKICVGCLNFWHLFEIIFEVTILIWTPGKENGAENRISCMY